MFIVYLCFTGLAFCFTAHFCEWEKHWTWIVIPAVTIAYTYIAWGFKILPLMIIEIVIFGLVILYLNIKDFVNKH